MSRLGIFGGTFDPPHLAHLVLADHACEQMALDKVLWVPAAVPPHKIGQQHTPVDLRVEMLRCAIGDHPRFDLSLVDVERPGPHFTVDMLTILGEQYPGDELVLLLGGDSLRDLPTWREPRQLVELARLAVMRRDVPAQALDELEQQIPGLRARLSFIEAPLLQISAADIRARVAAGLSIRYLVPAAVEAFIYDHSLYESSTG